MSLRRLRERAGLTQTAIARALYVSTSVVSAWERGRHPPATTMLPKLAQLLGCTVDELVDNLMEEDDHE